MLHHTHRRLRSLRNLVAGFMLCLLAASLGGCIEREETIQVDADGSVAIILSYAADSEDKLAKAGVPSEKDGWTIERRTETTSDKKTRHVVTATQRFAPGKALPATYAHSDDPDRDLQLHLPTTVRVEQRGDGTYYHFHRVFQGRPYAWWNLVEIREMNESLGKQIEQKKEKGEEITAEDWKHVLREQIAAQAASKLALARQAFKDAFPGAPLDHWGRAFRRAASALDDVNIDEVVPLLQAPDEEGHGEKLNEKIQQWEVFINRAIRDAVAAQGYGDKSMAGFDEALRKLNLRKQYTEQVLASKFKVRVVLPGEVVGSNTFEHEDGVPTWTVAGKQLMDRDVELLATSKVSRKPATE